MTAHVAPTPTRTLSAKTLGALAVVGLVVAFSLSSTLVKRAHTPGVLVAFWRLTTVSVVWNLYLRGTGRRVTIADVRQAFIPGIFFGLNLAVFFAGATHNSVANAALIGSLSPFLIVPLGARLFKEHINPRHWSSRWSHSEASPSCCSARRPTATHHCAETSSAYSR